jgi:N-acetylglucosamine-6-sulfatase
MSRRRLGRPALVGLLTALVVAAAALLLLDGSEIGNEEPEAPRAAGPPNLIVLMADDLGLAGYERALAGTRGLVGAEGTEFTQAIVSTPLCCPSRASFISGRYGHNNGVLANDPGYPTLRGKRSVLPVWLQAAGYRTAFVGKFMNGYERTARGAARRPAPGWDEWVEMRRTYGYYDYALNVGGALERHGRRREDYLTDVLSRHATEAIRRAADESKPLFLWLSWWAPHPENSARTAGPCRGSAIPPDREPGTYAEERLPDRPSIDEADVTDKPRFVRGRRALRPGDRMGARIGFRCRLASLGALERGVEAVVETLEELGELDNTALLFTSDNGFFQLEHRLPDGKGLPYEEAIRVPLLVDLPGSMGSQRPEVSAPVSSIDLAPTLLELAGASPCRRGARHCATPDGRSLLPLLSEGGSEDADSDRALLVEAAVGKPCPFAAVRTRRWMYAEHAASAGERLCRARGERELYDLEADPFELDNLLAAGTADPPPGVEPRLRRMLGRLRVCAGAAASDPITDAPPCR